MSPKIINLLRGAQDGLQLYTTEEISKDEPFWVPNHELMETLSGQSFHEVRAWVDDPANECYLPYESHLIAYVMDSELEPKNGTPVFNYVECPEKTYARIAERAGSEQEQ